MAAKAARLAFLAGACLYFATAAARADIVIGVAGPMSGQYQAFGQSLLNGVKAAVDKINASGGLKGEQLSIITADDQCDIFKAKEAANKLLTQNVDVVVGHFCSNPTLEAAKLYDKAGVTLIAPSAALPALTDSGLSNVIRVTTRLDAQGAFAAKRILAKRPNAKLAVVDDGSTDMKAIIASFAAAYGKPVTITASIVADQKDFAEVIAKLKAANIDTLYLATNGSDAGRITVVAAKAGLDLKRYGPDSLLIDTFWTASAADGENTLVSFPAAPENNSEAKVLSRDMKALGQATEGPFLPAYASVQLFADAAGQAGPHSKAKIAETLKSGDSFATILGPLSFDANGDTQDLRFNWYSWNNGVYQTIAPEN